METKTFEKALEQLEAIVRELEAGELPLEDAIEKFETGMQLSQYCSRKLDETEKRITLLLRDAENRLREEPFLEGAGESENV